MKLAKMLHRLRRLIRDGMAALQGKLCMCTFGLSCWILEGIACHISHFCFHSLADLTPRPCVYILLRLLSPSLVD